MILEMVLDNNTNPAVMEGQHRYHTLCLLLAFLPVTLCLRQSFKAHIGSIRAFVWLFSGYLMMTSLHPADVRAKRLYMDMISNTCSTAATRFMLLGL